MQSAKLPTRSALMVAALREIGAREMNPAHRNPDYLARTFLGEAERTLLAGLPVLEQLTAAHLPPIGENRAALTHMLRTRHIDTVLDNSLRDGAMQVAILGAGLDTRAYRFREQLTHTHVFEVDLPSTQAYKKQRILEIFGALPEHVTFVSIDFARQELSQALREAGWDPSKRTFFLWEGVCYYLSAERVDGVLRFVSKESALTSQILFDYFEWRLVRGEHDDEVWQQYARVLEAWGERFIFGIDECAREPFLSDRGLRLSSDATLGELCVRYCPDISAAGLGVGRTAYHFCVASVD